MGSNPSTIHQPLISCRSESVLSRYGDKWQWIVGQAPPALDAHSKVKHKVVRDYLLRYIQVLMASPKMPKLTLTLVDGFAGGGIFTDENQTSPGSPLILLETVRETEALLNLQRTKTSRWVDAHYHFVDINRNNIEYLKKTLTTEGYANRIGKDITIYEDAFENVSKQIVKITAARKGGQRAIFLLDQYAYDDIELPTVRHILNTLSGAEVILTFNVDSLLTFLTDNDSFRNITARIGLKEYIDWESYKLLKAQTRWREMIQRQLAYGIWKATGARFMTLFFVTPTGDRPWSYWLVHLSNVYKANDVMKGVHWEHGNSFGHSLEAGFYQIGYKANIDENVTGQKNLSFQEPVAFDNDLRIASIKNLGEHLPRIIHQNHEGILFSDLLDQIANQTNADANLIKESLNYSLGINEIQITSKTGGSRTKGSTIQRSDILIPNRQQSIFLPILAKD